MAAINFFSTSLPNMFLLCYQKQFHKYIPDILKHLHDVTLCIRVCVHTVTLNLLQLLDNDLLCSTQNIVHNNNSIILFSLMSPPYPSGQLHILRCYHNTLSVYGAKIGVLEQPH